MKMSLTGTLLLAMFNFGCETSKTDTVPPVAEIGLSDVRGLRWGMSVSEVTEKEEYTGSVMDGGDGVKSFRIDEHEYRGYLADGWIWFHNDKLAQVFYNFSRLTTERLSSRSLKRFHLVSESLYFKYGHPKTDTGVLYRGRARDKPGDYPLNDGIFSIQRGYWSQEWETDRTVITHRIYEEKNSIHHEVIYSATAYRDVKWLKGVGF